VEGAEAAGEAERAQPAERDAARPAEREAPPPEQPREPEARPLAAAYDLVRRALESLREMGRDAIRDSDLKRKMLEIDSSFDETTLGFSKFSRFLRQAHDHEVVNLQKQEGGNYEVSLAGAGAAAAVAGAPPPGETKARDEAVAAEVALTPSTPSGLGPRRGSTRRRQEQPTPPLLEGQVAARSTQELVSAARQPVGAGTTDADSADVDPRTLGLPTDAEGQIRYLTSYRGVGRKTAEALVEGFGENLFGVLQNEPERLETVVPSGRAEQVLQAWKADYQRRLSGGSSPRVDSAPITTAPAVGNGDPGQRTQQGGAGRRRTRRGGRRGGRDPSS
jgi:hypothetical protein